MKARKAPRRMVIFFAAVCLVALLVPGQGEAAQLCQGTSGSCPFTATGTKITIFAAATNAGTASVAVSVLKNGLPLSPPLNCASSGNAFTACQNSLPLSVTVGTALTCNASIGGFGEYACVSS
ncbi:MAG: hypothetical protein ABR548_05850 [Actinomycetota bacterium]|nr:hypothetical protein [Actinomycetota bacterium]